MSIVVILRVCAILLVAYPTVISQPSHGGPQPSRFAQQSTSSTPYMVMFQFKKNSSDGTPFVVYPVTAKSVWLMTFKEDVTFHSEIFNFTIGEEPQIVARLPYLSLSSIVLDGLHRIWLPRNDTLTYYDPATKNFTDAATFPGGSPGYLAIDPAGRVWMTLIGSNEIGVYDPTSGMTNRYPLPTQKAFPVGIYVGPDGMIWFLESGAKKLGLLDPNTGTITEYATPQGFRAPEQLTMDKNGLVWFTDHGSDQFGSFNPKTEEWRKLPVGFCSEACPYALPNAIASDSQGTIWFSEHVAGRIGRYDPESGILTEYVIPAPGFQRSRIGNWWAWPGPGNLVWFTTIGPGTVGYVNASVSVPLTLSAPAEVSVQREGYARFPVTVTYGGSQPVSVGLSPATSDFDGSIPLLSIQPRPLFGELLYGFSSHVVTAGNLSLGTRIVAVTASDGEISRSVYVNLTVTETILPYATITTSLIMAASGLVLYVRRRRQVRRSFPRSVIDAESDSSSIAGSNFRKRSIVARFLAVRGLKQFWSCRLDGRGRRANEFT